MTTIPKVSVIIPNYNCANFIEIAINSVLKQTEQNFEILIGDDCSTDDSLRIIKEISNRDKRIILFVNNKNSGPSATRNRLIDEAKGEWIALLDADDFYQPERLTKLIAIAEAQQADLIADNLINVDMEGKKLSDAMTPKQANNLIHVTAELMIQTDVPGSSGFKYGFLKPIMNRKFLNKNKIHYRKEIHVGEDFFLYLECLIKSAHFVLTTEPFYVYRIRPNSLTRSPDQLTMTRLKNNNQTLIDMALEYKKPNIVTHLKQRKKLYLYILKYENFVRLIKNRCMFDAINLVLKLPLSANLFFAKLMYTRLLTRWAHK